MGTSRKKILLTLAIVLVVAVIIGGGTFATFNASTTNASNAFETGTIVLSDTIGGTTCLSTGAGTNTDSNANSVGCAKVFNLTVKKPGDTQTVNVDLKNEGSLSGTLTFSVGSCTESDTAETYHGSGGLCAGVAPDRLVIDVGASTDVGFGGSGTVGALAAGATSTVPVKVTLPAGAGNKVQGKAAAFDITWTLTQA